MSRVYKRQFFVCASFHGLIFRMKLTKFLLSSLAVYQCNARDDEKDQPFFDKIPESLMIQGTNAVAMGTTLNPWVAVAGIASTCAYQWKSAGLNSQT